MLHPSPRPELPLVSIIITSYNYGHMLAEALRSACSQDYPQIEILVLDNASTDSTFEVMQEFIHHPHVYYLRNPYNLGATRNHNRGIIESRGEYLNFLSADDRMAPDQISKTLKYLQENPNVDIAYSEIHTLDAEGTYTGQRRSLVPAGYSAHPHQFALFLTYGCYAAFETMLIPRWVFGIAGLLDESLIGADYESIIRWAAAGVRFGFLPEAFLYYRIHNNQDSGAEKFITSGKTLSEYLYIINKHLNAESAPRIQGYEHRINRHILSKLNMVKDFGYQENEEILNLVEQTTEKIEQIRQKNHAQPTTAKCSVIVLAARSATDVQRTITSLLEQSYQNWEALIILPANTDLWYCENIPERVRMIALTEIIPKGQALNVALHLATGDFYTFLHAGNTFSDDHLSRLQWAFSHHELEAYLSPTRIVLHDTSTEKEVSIFHDFSKIDMLRIAPIYPLEAIAVRREGFDRCNTFIQEFEIFNEWEILLRSNNVFTLGALTNSYIKLHERVGQANRSAVSPYLIETLQKMYRLSHVYDPNLTDLRNQYLCAMQCGLKLFATSNWSQADHLAWYELYNADWLIPTGATASTKEERAWITH